MDGGRQIRLLVAVAGVAVLVAGCRMDAEVALDVDGDGSGEVQVAVVLDEEAAGRITDLAAELRLDDLAAAGWAVEGPEDQGDGSTRVAVSKPFATPEDAGEVMAEVSGPGGPLRGLTLERRRSFLSTTFSFNGEVDLTAGIDGFSDDELRQRLEGSGFGLGTADLERVTGAPVSDTFGLEVRAELPGGPRAGEASTGVPHVTGEAVVWRPDIGEVTTLAATSNMVHRERLVWLGVALAAALAVVLVLARRARRSRRDAPPANLRR